MDERQIASSLDSLEKRLDSVTSVLSGYRGETEEISEAVDLAPVDSQRQALQPGDSLFEAILEQIVQGLPSGFEQQIDRTAFDELISSAPDMACALDAEGRIVSLNRFFTQELGFSRETVIGRPFGEILGEGSENHNGLRSRLTALSPKSEPVTGPEDILLLRAQHPGGSQLSLECVTCAADCAGERLLIVALRDLTLRRSLVEQLRQSRDNYDALSESLSEAIIRIDEAFTIVFANSAVRNTFGYEPEELRNKRFSTLFPLEIYRRHEQEFHKYFLVDHKDRGTIGLQHTMEILGKHKHRGVTPMEMSFGNSKDFRGRTLTCIIRDITQRKSAERRLRQLAYHDQLTGLGNRDLFDSDMRKLFAQPERFATGMAALLFLDLDGFKQVNDTMGHDAGDRLLIDTGVRLQRALRESDSVYRFGGDEFVVLLGHIHVARDAAVVARTVLDEIHRPYELAVVGEQERRTATVGASIGIALIPADGSSVEAVTRAADLAMYHAKESGRHRFAFYSIELNTRAQERWKLEQGIRSALSRGEFALHYQPIVESHSVVCGLEALLRWRHPEQGEISPGRFIPVAEETGLIVPLGHWVMETAFRDIRHWNDNGYPDLYVAVNLSPRQFDHAELVDTVGGAIARSGVSPANVKLEITETCIMSAPRQAIAKMQLLKQRYPGLTISIDDFGTGYSSLSYLSQLPADAIKIDLSFVSDLFAVNNQKVVNAIINLAHSMKLDIVAEGVESRVQWEYFNNHHCNSLQGFHFSAAVARDQIGDLLGRGRLAEL